MYSTLAIRESSKHSGKIVGTHQKLDRIARKTLSKSLDGRYFPSTKEILHFEGMRGPDGLKRKSPGKDEPMHFILPDHDDGELIKLIKNHQYNLKRALRFTAEPNSENSASDPCNNPVRAAFEAAWLAHAITDGLTPAHHFPLSEAQNELMTEKEFVTVFGVPVKGIMHGRSTSETLRNNWLYWGADGYMSKHIAFEYGVAITMTALPDRVFVPKLSHADQEKLKNPATIDLSAEFYHSLRIIADLDMYTRFRTDGWTTELALETKKVLLPEIIRCIMMGWGSAL
ncbi:hypothetical protein IJG66_01350 [Candidatus Saccharibacteria bacterium]|nr:hypothetical protein [Candidatus Saccharibacteria bacterium]